MPACNRPGGMGQDGGGRGIGGPMDAPGNHNVREPDGFGIQGAHLDICFHGVRIGVPHKRIRAVADAGNIASDRRGGGILPPLKRDPHIGIPQGGRISKKHVLPGRHRAE